MKKCAYCNKETKMTREHIFPKCLVNRMPELQVRYFGIQTKFISSELVIADVCADCNNTKLSILDNYLCQLFDKYFKKYIENRNDFIFEYNYELLIRTLLKITFNSSRTVKKENSYFAKYKEFILNGGNGFESIVVKLDITLPSIIDEVIIYPKSVRCGTINVGVNSDGFILRMIAINSFYFYIIISENEFVEERSLSVFSEICDRIPGTFINPYKKDIIVKNHSNSDTLGTHLHFVTQTDKEFEEFQKNKRK